MGNIVSLNTAKQISLIFTYLRREIYSEQIGTEGIELVVNRIKSI